MARFIMFKAFASNTTTSRRPRSPSSNHNVKEPFLERISIMPETQHRPQDCARRAAWARCIGGLSGPVKPKRTENSYFLRGLWMALGKPGFPDKYAACRHHRWGAGKRLPQ